MVLTGENKVKYLVVDTTAFIENAALHNIAENVVTVREVVNEITNKRQLKRLVVLPYDLVIKDVFPESVKTVTEFAKKTGDFPCLSATDLKVMALTYQLEKEHVGIEHLRKEPLVQKNVNVVTKPGTKESLVGFFMPGGEEKSDELECNEFLEINDININEDDDDSGWITPSNVRDAKKQIHSELTETKSVQVACITTDFAMQNVLKQMNLNVSALDGRIIKQLRTFILRCYTCFKTTSLMTKTFCPNCGNNTLKRVVISVDENGKQQVHINSRRPLTSRGKKFSLPSAQGGKHSNNPVLVPDQRLPDQKPSRLARTKNQPMGDDYIAGYSPFVMRDVTSKSAQLCIRPNSQIRHWMRKNPNEAQRKRK